jgi:hypothetical protein
MRRGGLSTALLFRDGATLTLDSPLIAATGIVGTIA